MRIAVLVLSDRCAGGQAEDRSGPELLAWLADHGESDATLTILPDDHDAIVSRLRQWCDDGAHDLVLTCGGTGVSPRDVTPEATRAVIDRELPGFGEAMRAASLQVSPHAVISRALAGLRRATLIINLPGSPRAARENLAAVWPAVPHCVAKAGGDQTPCGES